ncbi:MAG: ABC transporter ATP-binding protein, partial [Bergeyella zoohelcum]|nr:ABC transporter ATP-binding protein [Bergeyella zoohelcum]
CLLIGNNGVGKTTLIKSILKQIDLLNGCISINNKDISKLSFGEIAQEIAVVFSKVEIPSNYSLTDLISLGKYIHYPYYFDLNEKDKKEVDKTIQLLDLEQYKNLKLHQLSDGNLQKTFIGRAIIQNSPIIILDEPTTHLDEENKLIILNLLKKLAKDYNKLILFSSHDWRLAKDFADKIWLIENQTLHTGLTEDILLKHNLLDTNTNIFSHKNLVLPHIDAPSKEKNLVISFINKNLDKDLSPFSINFDNEIWTISTPEKQWKADSFGEILSILKGKTI